MTFLWNCYQEQEDHYNEFWSKLVTDLEDAIKIEKSEVVNFEAASKDILTARRENVAIQLETVYRERALDVYNKVSELCICFFCFCFFSFCDCY